MGNVHIGDSGGGHPMLGRDGFGDRDWCATCRRWLRCPRYKAAHRSGRRWCPSYEYRNRVAGDEGRR